MLYFYYSFIEQTKMISGFGLNLNNWKFSTFFFFMSKSNYPHFEQDSFLKKDENSTTTVIVDENPPQKANSRNPINPTINISQKEMKEYIEENKELYGSLIQFLNNLDNNENYFQDLINIIRQQKQEENSEQIFIFKKV